MNLIIRIFSLILLIPSYAVSIKCFVCHKDISKCEENPPPTLLHECDEEVSFCFTQADHIIVRGCFHPQSGISPRAFTRLCDEDGCNNEPFIRRSQLKCQVCTEDGCEGNLRECKHNVILYRKDFCYSALSSGGKGLKGCLLEAPMDVQTICNPMDAHRDRCVTCQYDGCNRQLIPPLHTRCLSSAGATVDCRSFKSSERIGCFSRHSNGRLELGCNTQLSEESFKECAKVSNDTCQLCMKSMCNDLQEGRLQACAFGNEGSILTPKYCKSASDRCVLFDAFGLKLYNCESSILCLTPFCYFCTGHMCNWDLKPSLSCHICNSTDNCRQNLINLEEFKGVCPRSKHADQCFSVIDEKNEIHRGCYSEDREGLCDRFPSKCIKCANQNYCNDKPVVKSTLVCFKCSNEDDCAIERSTMSKTAKCLDRFEGQTESCYEIQDAEVASRVERGCTLDNPQEKLRKNAQFSYCDSHFCNSKRYALRRCLSCEGTEVDSVCHRMGADAVQLMDDCETVPGQMEASQCFTLYLNDTTILRGCHIQMKDRFVEFCKKNLDKFCFICHTDACNKMKLWQEKCFNCMQNCTRMNGTVVEPRVKTATRCRNISTDDKNGCFITRIDEKQDYRQGCVADLMTEEYKTCLVDKENCEICTGGSCNYELKNKSRKNPKLFLGGLLEEDIENGAKWANGLAIGMKFLVVLSWMISGI